MCYCQLRVTKETVNEFNTTARLISLFSKNMLGEIGLRTLQILSLERLISYCMLWLDLVMFVLVRLKLVWSDLL